MGNIKAIYDEKGNVIDFVEEDEELEEMLAPENDPYWQSPIPKSERKHRRDKLEESKATKIVKITLMVAAPLSIIGLVYYIVLQFI